MCPRNYNYAMSDKAGDYPTRRLRCFADGNKFCQRVVLSHLTRFWVYVIEFIW